jgi:tetratricopeptide (TPR) repeat protein
VIRLARAERAAGRPERALARLDAALEETPGWVELRLARAEALGALGGREGEARSERETALAMIDGGGDGLDPAARAHLLWLRARLLEDLGRREEAARTLGGVLARPDLLRADARREARGLAGRLGIEPPDGAPEPPR